MHARAFFVGLILPTYGWVGRFIFNCDYFGVFRPPTSTVHGLHLQCESKKV